MIFSGLMQIYRGVTAVVVCLSAMLPASLSALSLDTDTPPVFLDLLALPRPLLLAIFALIPVDTRLRCIEVNRAWRALLADTTFCL